MTTPTTTPKQILATALLALVIAIAAMAFTMPTFASRLFRPFTSATRLGISPDTSGGNSAATAIPEGAQKATLAAGCFWGVEHLYRKHFGNKGLYDARVGYTGGDVNSPSYRAVCTGQTGHAESVQLHFDPQRLTYQQILEFFYQLHDPTTANRQGPDVGPQYRSAIYVHDAEQERVARDVTKRASEQWYNGGIVTEIVNAGRWWDAEEYHQQYLHHNPSGYECPTHFLRKFPPLQ
ncbi:PMSR-domain-containing protein [Hypoxylon fragiforme]|uniref:PMSR-domain-containing protein n=1 Tax=Hypoxylon fragiforme TaxID=63214 RepID=UPI0020C72733|nr:PMSR-domain-containing protein [Hypoxylon fragiforme]KAI2604198.1 PMSR-domain-containing protein [Hypoxylon fragiforme]